MPLRLADGVFGVTIDQDLVFLDVAADVYFCLPQAAGIQVHADGGVSVEDPETAQALVETGLVQATQGLPATRPAARTAERTARKLIEAGGVDPKVSLRHWRAMLGAVWTAFRGRGRSFAALLPAQAARPVITAHLLEDLAVYRRLWPWLPVDGVCLFRSHLLRSYLVRLGHTVDWVFGVRTWPFAAHCWLQVEDVALDDEAERLAAYWPIMVA